MDLNIFTFNESAYYLLSYNDCFESRIGNDLSRKFHTGLTSTNVHNLSLK